MKKTGIILACVVILVGMVMLPGMAKKNDGATIQDGTIEYGRDGDTNTEIIPIGYDLWGYNYQAHMFNGWFYNSVRPDPPYTKDTIDLAPSKTWLVMKWSDTWLSNRDRDATNKLDRGYPTLDGGEPWDSSAAEGAWVTNHQRGSYIGDDGKEHKWTYFIKIVYPPGGAVGAEGDIDPATGGEIIWGSYVIIQEVSNDPYADEHGLLSKAETPTGFGAYK